SRPLIMASPIAPAPTNATDVPFNALFISLLSVDQVRRVGPKDPPAPSWQALRTCPTYYGRTCPVPSITHLYVVSSLSANGPRACSFCVEMPTSAPNPNSPPSVNCVLAFTYTAAASTSLRKRSAAARSLVTMASEWPDP